MRLLFGILAPLSFLLCGLEPTADEAARPVEASDKSAPAALHRDTAWAETARFQVSLSRSRAQVLLDSLTSFLDSGRIETARRRPDDTTRHPLSALREKGLPDTDRRRSAATHLVLGYSFAIVEGASERDVQETLQSVSVVADSTAECDLRYEPLIHLDATRDPLRSYLTTTGATVQTADATRTYEALTEVVRFAPLYKAARDSSSYLLTIGEEKTCGENLPDRDDLREPADSSSAWQDILIAQ